MYVWTVWQQKVQGNAQTELFWQPGHMLDGTLALQR